MVSPIIEEGAIFEVLGSVETKNTQQTQANFPMNDNEKNEQRKVWKAEARQLKSDLDNRPKIVRRNPVQIRLSDAISKKEPPPTPKPKGTDSTTDSFLRQILGI